MRGSALVFLAVGPGLEAGVGPLLLTAGYEAGGAPVAVRVLGALILVTAVPVILACFGRFDRDGDGTPAPAVPTRRLVARGPYARVRHPLYLATAAAIAAQALLLGRPVLGVAAAVYLATTASLATWIEEPRLRERFGAAYEAYARVTPAWIPRPR